MDIILERIEPDNMKEALQNTQDEIENLRSLLKRSEEELKESHARVDELHSKWSPLCMYFGMVFVHSVKLSRVTQPLDSPEFMLWSYFLKQAHSSFSDEVQWKLLEIFLEKLKTLLFVHKLYLYVLYVSHD